MTRVLLTGATGFLGRPTLQTLCARGIEVHAVSRRAQGENGGAVCHRADLLDHGAVWDLLEAVRPSHLLHLAWHADRATLYDSPENEIWGFASLYLLSRFAALGGERAVMVGSCAEYDWHRGGVFSERDPVGATATAYGWAKATTGKLAMRLTYPPGAPPSLAWARPFFLYGPGEAPDRLLASVTRAILAGEPARCTHGRQLRDYLYVDDAAEALVALLESDVEGAVNIGSGTPLPLLALVNEAAGQLDRPDLVELGALPAPSDEAPLVVADVARLRDEVGFRPQVALEDGVERSIAWWRSGERAARR